MKIQVNNKEMELGAAATVNELAARLQLPGKGVAIAVNNKMLPRDCWAARTLCENDSVVIIKAACGG